MRVGDEIPGVRVQLRLGGREREIVISEDRVEQARGVLHAVLRGPFTKRPWRELLFFVISGLLAAVGMAFIAVTMSPGSSWPSPSSGLVDHRRLAARGPGDRRLPAGAGPRPARRGDRRTGTVRGPARASSAGSSRHSATASAGGRWPIRCSRCPLAVFGVWFAFSVWVDAFFCLTYPVWGSGTAAGQEFGVVCNLFQPGYLSVGTNGLLPRPLHLHHRRHPVLRRSLDHAGRGLRRPPAHARPPVAPTP